jgi:hypothetical protein
METEIALQLGDDLPEALNPGRRRGRKLHGRDRTDRGFAL